MFFYQPASKFIAVGDEVALFPHFCLYFFIEPLLQAYDTTCLIKSDVSNLHNIKINMSWPLIPEGWTKTRDNLTTLESCARIEIAVFCLSLFR